MLAPPGEATGGHALPGAGLMPGLPGEVAAPLLWLFPLSGAALEPEFGAVPELPSVVPGKVPQGLPLGEPPGVFGLLGLTVEGCVGVPGVGVAGEFDPGTVGFGVPLGEKDPGEFGFCGAAGVAVCAGGVAGLAGGVAVPAGGVAGAPGVEFCPAVLELAAGGVPADGTLCATAQLAQQTTINNNVIFRVNIFKPLLGFSMTSNSVSMTYQVHPDLCPETLSTQLQYGHSTAWSVSSVCRSGRFAAAIGWRAARYRPSRSPKQQ